MVQHAQSLSHVAQVGVGVDFGLTQTASRITNRVTNKVAFLMKHAQTTGSQVTRVH